MNKTKAMLGLCTFGMTSATQLTSSAKYSDTCQDTDNGALDSYGDPCSAYNRNKGWCQGYDDDDFDSVTMCCACGGGTGWFGCDVPGWKWVDWINDWAECRSGTEAECEWYDSTLDTWNDCEATETMVLELGCHDGEF